MVYNTSVHNLGNVPLPLEIKKLLGLGHKFIPQAKLDNDLPREAYRKFSRSLRIKEFFQHKPDNPDYDPRFYIPNLRWKPPPVSFPTEKALASFRKYIPEVREENPTHHLGHIPKKWHEFASHPDILIKPSDKNLGLTIVNLDWYIKEGLRQLSDSSTYRKVNMAEDELKILSKKEAAHLWQKLNVSKSQSLKQYYKAIHRGYIQHQLDYHLEIPKFHLIPKIHKEPVKGRPIIPSHSWTTSPFSKWIDTVLQQGLQHCPTVLKDTKELINQLDQLTIPATHTLTTGDVTSMYTNIPTEEGITRVVGFLHIVLSLDGQMARLLKKVLQFIMTGNYFQFNGEFYLQINGTAMGTSCAPAYANIFMYTLEREMETIFQPFFYRRYIDDIFFISAPEEVEELTWYMGQAHSAIEIEWNAKRPEMDFLDLHMDTNPFQYRTHQKTLNKYLYIPFKSYHPPATKKGFIKAELIRYVRNSSNQRLFEKTARDFFTRLRLRGYPPRFLRHVFGQVFYSHRSQYLTGDKPPPDRNMIPFVTTYNEVYKHPLFPIIMQELREDLPRYKIVTSYRKNPNLMDIFHKINAKKLARKHDFRKRRHSNSPSPRVRKKAQYAEGSTSSQPVDLT